MINKTAELVRLWAEYEVLHPEATLEEFYRFMLISEREKSNKEGFLGGNIPPNLNSVMAKLIGRLAQFQFSYVVSALKEVGVNNLDDFMFLNVISHNPNSRKTEVINQNFTELSSGLLVIERLKKANWVLEQNDLEDKRSKRLSLTTSGQQILFDCYQKLGKASELFYGDMSEDDIKLCIQLLTQVDIKFSSLWPLHKGKTFAENYEAVLAERKNTIKR